jgi:AraC-like DNA-binding protein
MPQLLVLKHNSPLGNWTFMRREPIAALREHVSEFWVADGTTTFSKERILPLPGAVLMFNFADEQGTVDRAGNITPFRSAWASGLRHEVLTTYSSGRSSLLGVRFTPLGAYAFFRIPMDQLANRVLELEDIFGSDAEQTLNALRQVPDWPSRIDRFEQLIAERLADSDEPSREIGWMLNMLNRANGRVQMRALQSDLGWSAKRTIARFKEHVGLTPKTYARLLRFRAAVTAIEAADDPDWCELAFHCGFYDQAHLINEFRAFSDCSPREFLRLRVPASAGFQV